MELSKGAAVVDDLVFGSFRLKRCATPVSPMTDKRLREIAALEVELAMTEAHARKLSAVIPGSTNLGEENQVAILLKEENERAEVLRRKIRLLKNPS